MSYYYNNSTSQQDDFVDERWDGVIEQRKEQNLNQIFQTLAMANQELSPPLSSGDKKNNKEIHTSFFREDIDDGVTYFTEPLDTPKEEDYLTSLAAIQENNETIIQSPTLPSPTVEFIESFQPEEEEINEKMDKLTGPVNFEYYHRSMVHYYQDMVSTMELDNEVFDALPVMYKEYLVAIQHHTLSFSPLPCTF